MKVQLLFFLASLFFINELNSQSIPSILWDRCYGGSEAEYVGNVIEVSTGGYLIVGETQSDDGIVAGAHGSVPNISDFLVVRVDETGSIIWQKCYGGTQSEYAFFALETTDHHFVIAGSARSNDGDVTGVYGSADGWLIKIDSSGSLIWQKTFGGSFAESFYQVTNTMDGGFALCGNSRSNDGDVGFHYGTPNSHWDGWIVKTDSVGNIQWETTIGGTLDDAPRKIIQNSDGTFLVSGSSSSTDGDMTCNHSIGNGDVWITKLDSSGNKIWFNCYGGTGHELEGYIVNNSQSFYTIASTTSSNDGDVSGFNGGRDFWMFKIDSTGNLLSQKCFGGTNLDALIRIVNTSDSGFLLSGTTGSNNIDVSGNHGFDDYWVVKTDSIMNLEWQMCLGGTGNDYGIGAIQNASDDIVVYGYAYSSDGNVTYNYGFLDIWLIKLSSPAPSALNDPFIAEQMIQFNPNPMFNRSVIKFENDHEEDYFLNLVDLSGRIVETYRSNSNEIVISRQNKRSGLYFYTLWKASDNKRVMGKLLMQ